MSDPIRVLIADDQVLVREGLAALLGAEPDLEVVAQAGDGEEACAVSATLAAEGRRPDVAMLDIEMPVLDGISATSALAERVPGVRVLIVTTFGRPGYLRRAMDAGASGFVVKDTPARQLAEAIRRVHAGLRVVDPVLAAESLTSGPNPLTAREAEILRVSSAGDTIAAVAKEVALSQGTVRNHLSSAIGKTGAATRAEAARIAADNGWL